MLYKYTTFITKSSEDATSALPQEDEIRTILIGKNAIVNAIMDNSNGKKIKSFQKCAKDFSEKISTKGFPDCIIDMSNARGNNLEHIKDLVPDSRIYRANPITDAEVICTFNKVTDLCKRFCEGEDFKKIDLNLETYCVLLFKYFKKLAEENAETSENKEAFEENYLKIFIKEFKDKFRELINSCESDKEKAKYINAESFLEYIVLYAINYKDKVTEAVANKIDYDAIGVILENVDWEEEKKYIARTNKGFDSENPEITGYNTGIYEGYCEEINSGILKKILIATLKKSNQK